MIVALPDNETGMLVTTKVALVAPAPTVTVAGTVARDVLLLERLTTPPPAGALPVRVTVPVEGVPPTTVVGFSVTELSCGRVTVNVEFRVTPL